MKLVIDIDENLLNEAKNGHIRLGDIADAVINTGIPYIEPDNSMELIDKKALKKAMQSYADDQYSENEYLGEYCVMSIIDDAYPIKTFTLEDVYKQYLAGLEKGTDDSTLEISDVKELINTASTVEDRMVHVQDTVNTIMNSCTGNNDIDKAFRNAARLVQNAIDGKAPDFEQIERSDNMNNMKKCT